MKARELRQKYIDFFLKKDHKLLPNVSLVPSEIDSSVLFTTAGMHPLVPYLLGEPHPLGKRLISVQRCIRTPDIEEVGNPMHLTFFEMLGNWSLGDYFKEEAIAMSYEFLTKELGLDPDRLSVTVFEGDDDAPRDEESAAIWQKLGIPKERIFYYPKEDNWWGPAGKTGPCGPDTEMFYDTGLKKCGPDCAPGCHCGKYFEIWNDVFMEYNKKEDGTYEPLKQKNVDTGMGVARTATMLQGKGDIYQTELFEPIIKEIEAVSGRGYSSRHSEFISESKGSEILNQVQDDKAIDAKAMRIIADHLRAAVFIIMDGVVPSNVEQGYVLRRLIRRAVRYGKQLGIEDLFTSKIAEVVINEYKDLYPGLEKSREVIIKELNLEEETFAETLSRGEKELDKLLGKKALEKIDGKSAFRLYETYGFPIELTQELAKEKGLEVDLEGFKKAEEEHRRQSRAGAEKKFAGGLADHSEQVARLHTATHLLHAALRKVLGEHVQQKGSNITAERLRFDFSHPEKLTDEEIKKVERLVNEQIEKDLPVKCETMSLEEAKKQGALAFFGQKYSDKVKVYSIAPSTSSGQEVFSKEVCGGPHAKSTGDLGSFKIVKEQSVARGVRRIKAAIGS